MIPQEQTLGKSEEEKLPFKLNSTLLKKTS